MAAEQPPPVTPEARALRGILRLHVGNGRGRAGACPICDVAQGYYCVRIAPVAHAFTELRTFEVEADQRMRLADARRALGRVR